MFASLFLRTIIHIFIHDINNCIKFMTGAIVKYLTFTHGAIPEKKDFKY